MRQPLNVDKFNSLYQKDTDLVILAIWQVFIDSRNGFLKMIMTIKYLLNSTT
jgi:hypothetical protein